MLLCYATNLYDEPHPTEPLPNEFPVDNFPKEFIEALPKLLWPTEAFPKLFWLINPNESGPRIDYFNKRLMILSNKYLWAL